jgi:hypothetical protein
MIVIAISLFGSVGRQAQARPSKMRPTEVAASPGPVITPGDARALKRKLWISNSTESPAAADPDREAPPTRPPQHGLTTLLDDPTDPA